LSDEKIEGTELDYVRMINSALPEDIRVWAWAPAPDSFSARFDCIFRVYRYFFVKKGMDIAAMNQAAQLLKGSHDFRNFCKINPGQAQNLVRTIMDINIVKSDLAHQT